MDTNAIAQTAHRRLRPDILDLQERSQTRGELDTVILRHPTMT